VKGQVAHVGAHPFIKRCSIRDNILFGQPYSAARYCAALTTCGVPADQDHCSINDLQCASNSSRQQLRIRIALARALYSCADILLLDDSVDTVLCSTPQILQHLLTVRNRCVILATSAPHQLLQCADYIVVLAAGRVQQTATYAQLCSTAIGRAALDSYTRPLQCNSSSNSSSNISAHSSAVQHRHNSSNGNGSTSSNSHRSISSGNGDLRVTQSSGHVIKGVAAPSNGTSTFTSTHSSGNSISRDCCCCCSTTGGVTAANTAHCSWSDSIGSTHRAAQIVAVLSIAQLCDVVATWYNFNSTLKLLALVILQLVLTVAWELVLRLCTLYEAAVVHARSTHSNSSSSSSHSIGSSTNEQQQRTGSSDTDCTAAAVTAAECVAVVLCERTRVVLLAAAVVYATPLMLLILVPTAAVCARWYWMHSTLAEQLAVMQAVTAPELQLHTAEVIKVSTLYKLLVYCYCTSEYQAVFCHHFCYSPCVYLLSCTIQE
jgi:hypothetical protein